MRRLLQTGLISCYLLALSVGAVGAQKTMEVTDLGQYKWQHRLLLLFTPGADDPAYRTLNGELSRNISGVRERDLLVFHLLEAGRSFSGTQEISPQQADTLRRRFGITPGVFNVVLVGKDGTVKLQRPGPVALADVFGLIDSMPMRRQEMQRN